MTRYRRVGPRAAKRLLVPLVGTLSIAPVPAMSAAPQAEWSTISLAGGAFSALFPVERPTAKSYIGPGGTLHVWFAETRAGLFIAAEAPDSSDVPAAAEHVAASLSAKLVAAKEVAIRGAPRAIRYSLALRAGETGDGVLVPAEHHVYALLALTGPKQEVAASRFVASIVVPASAKAAELLAGKGRIKAPAALSAREFDTGEHLASALLPDPAVVAPVQEPATAFAALAAKASPATIAASPDRDGSPHPDGASTQGGSLALDIPPASGPKSSPDTVIADAAPATPGDAAPFSRVASLADRRPSAATVSDTSDRDGIPDPHADLGGDRDGGIATQQRYPGAEIAPAPDATRSLGSALDQAAPRTPVESQPLSLPTSPIDLRPAPATVADTSDRDGIPDPHPDLGGDRESGISTRQPDLGAKPADSQPAARPTSPTDLRPSPALNPPAPAAALPPSPPHWLWLPEAWRWNGYYWQWLPGHWARAAE